MPNGTRKKFNVYAKTKAECEKKLAKMIAEKKAEIAKQKSLSRKRHKKRVDQHGQPSNFAMQ